MRIALPERLRRRSQDEWTDAFVPATSTPEKLLEGSGRPKRSRNELIDVTQHITGCLDSKPDMYLLLVSACDEVDYMGL